MDEEPVERHLDREHGEPDEHRGPRPGHAFAEAAQGHVGQHRRQAEARGAQIAGRHRDGPFVHPEQAIRGLHVLQQHGDCHTAANRDPQRLPHDRPGVAGASRPVQLRNRRRHRHHDPRHEQHQRPVQVAAEGDAREVRGAHAPRHDGVGDPHAHLRKLRDDDGHGEHAERAELRQGWPAIHGMRRGSSERRRILQAQGPRMKVRTA